MRLLAVLSTEEEVRERHGQALHLGGGLQYNGADNVPARRPSAGAAALADEGLAWRRELTGRLCLFRLFCSVHGPESRRASRGFHVLLH